MGFGKDGKGAILREQINGSALGALAAKDGIVVAGGITLAEDFRILKSEITAVVIGLTTGQGEDGLSLHMCNGDLAEADIEECLETNGPLNRSDRDLTERAERFVRKIGVIAGHTADAEHSFVGETNSPMIVVKPRWTFSNATGWKYFVYNDGVLLTTGATVELMATHYGVWVT